MPILINSVDIIGDNVLADSIIDRSITEYNDDIITSIGPYAFNKCARLANVSLPNVTSIMDEAFAYCDELSNVDTARLNSIVDFAFRNCSSLTTLILRNVDKVSSLYNSNAFIGTPIESGSGYVYTPSALLDKYKSALYWSKYKNQFRILEEWTIDGTIMGDLDLENRHMIRFFNSDGTLLGHQVVRTGEDASYDGTPICPDDASIKFMGFRPDPTNITTDMDCYARYLTLEGATWDEIAEISESGKAEECFSVGDTKPISWTWYDGTVSDVIVEIIGFNHDILADGSGNTGITFGTKSAIDLQSWLKAMPNMQYGWVNSEFRTILNSSGINMLPTEVSQHIKTVKKESMKAYGDNTKEFSEDKLFAPSGTEFTGMGFSDGEDIMYYGSQYDHFKTVGNRRKYKQDNSMIETHYTAHFSREPSELARIFCGYINIDGSYKNNADVRYQSCICFCV